MFTFNRTITLAIVVFVSVTIPMAISCWSVISAISGKPPDGISYEIKIYQGVLKNHELWFIAYTYTGMAFAPSSESCRIKCLDLETGIERETGLTLSGDGSYLITLRDELYCVGRTALYRVDDTAISKLAALPPRFLNFHTIPFLFDHQITTIRASADAEFQLMHLDNGNWVEGRKILLPGHNRVWYDDPERGCKRLLPLASQQPVPAPVGARPLIAWVIPHNEQYHIFCTDFSGFAAYRTGFEFADELNDGPSALAPENAPQEVSGWEPIQPVGDKDHWHWMVDDLAGLLFANKGSACRVVRRNWNGQWEELTGASVRPNCVILGDANEPTTYIVSEDQKWGSAVVHRIEGNTIKPAHLVLRGSMPEYLARWRRLLSGLAIAWLTHVAVLIAGTVWLTKRETESVYEFGNQQARLQRQRGDAYWHSVLI